jgi:TniQ
MVLPVTLELHEDEAPTSLVARLAAANGFSSLRSFLGHTEISVGAIGRGEDQALRAVSEWSGIFLQELGGLVSEPGGAGLTWRLGKAMFNKDMRPGRMFRFCAKCVLDDRERQSGRLVSRAYHRAWWSVRAIEGCHIHDRRLTEVAISADGDPHDFPRFVESNLDLVTDEASRPVTRSQPLLDRHLLDRIFGASGTPFLDGMEVHVAAELSRYLGDFLALHDVDDWKVDGFNTREWGFRLASEGEARIREVMARVIDLKRPTLRVESVLGPMVHWLRRNISKAPYLALVDLMQDILARNMPFGPGQTILNPVTSRHMYCVNSAHAEFGLHKERIRTLMAELNPGFRRDLPDSRTYFNADAARPILLAATDTLTSTEAAALLGLGDRSMRGLLSDGIVEQVEMRSDDTRAYARIRKAAVDELHRRLTDNMAEVAGDDGLISLQDATQKWQRPFHKVVVSILDGTVEAYILPGKEPVLSRARVKPGALNHDVSENAGGDEEWMRAKEAERLLATTTGSVNELIRRGYLQVQSRRRENGKTVKLVERRSVTKFMAEHISLTAFTKCRSGFRGAIKAELDKAGIKPIFEPEGFVARFYRRSDLAQVE